MAHDTTIAMIKEIISRKVNLKKIYIDTVGDPDKYREKLEKIFIGIDIVVCKKADSIYPVVSAASICAKVTRDNLLLNWTFSEDFKFNRDFGSGYPSGFYHY
jgi:ribonuclease H2 subunit A